MMTSKAEEFEALFDAEGSPSMGDLAYMEFCLQNRDLIARALRRDEVIEDPGSHRSHVGVVNIIADAVQEGIVTDTSYIGIVEDHILPAFREAVK